MVFIEHTFHNFVKLSHSQSLSQKENWEQYECQSPNDGSKNSGDRSENFPLNKVANEFTAQGEWKKITNDLKWQITFKYDYGGPQCDQMARSLTRNLAILPTAKKNGPVANL